mmetsp:Transcript_37535/g.45844  ORF Transcript_37535/g.45844 Transcript_37535/m.45844 type:complete len:123 (-) Transcript_37535:655-1023(-)
MPKRKRQKGVSQYGSPYDDLPWEKVDLQTISGTHEIDNSNDGCMGMFCGLEVISGDKLNIGNKESTDGSVVVEEVNNDVAENDESDGQGVEEAGPSGEPEPNKKTTTEKKNKKKKKKEETSQ